MGKSKVLIIGGTGYMGKRLVKASLAQGHETYVMQRPDTEIGVDIDKVETLISFKKQGAHLVPASFEDYKSLVEAVKLVDIVICAVSGVHIRSHSILLQLKLVEAIKEAGNVKRYIPSEFGMDAEKMKNAMEPGKVTFDDKMVVRKAIEEAGIPFTYVSANCIAAYWLGGLCQFGKILPPRDHVIIHGDGNLKGIYVNEDDIATYTIKTIDDPRTLNKTIYICPPENILSQREVVQKWEKLIGKELHKITLSKDDFLASKKALDFGQQVGLSHYHDILYEGFLTSLKIGDEDEASKLYPEVKYTTVEEYLEQYNTLTSLIRPSFSFPNHTDRQCKIFNTTPASPLLPEIASVTQTPIGRYPFPGAGGTKFSRGLTIQSIYYSDTPATNHMDLPSSEVSIHVSESKTNFLHPCSDQLLLFPDWRRRTACTVQGTQSCK
ncbi:bifunctional pinoresinol-lariciresinol reductase [Olea europaea subsp. europaea]|uniref:(+)-lariciresinol reductase n=1 Tax=Olea europaea subsp. europaea TaxID=158383 RepID=A0A8S0QFP4_OLEEU|nr:bifunctional pinoresinol-lariciresinol reductase [Olea europaea subsp. europaea]